MVASTRAPPSPPKTINDPWVKAGKLRIFSCRISTAPAAQTHPQRCAFHACKSPKDEGARQRQNDPPGPVFARHRDPERRHCPAARKPGRDGVPALVDDHRQQA